MRRVPSGSDMARHPTLHVRGRSAARRLAFDQAQPVSTAGERNAQRSSAGLGRGYLNSLTVSPHQEGSASGKTHEAGRRVREVAEGERPREEDAAQSRGSQDQGEDRKTIQEVAQEHLDLKVQRQVSKPSPNLRMRRDHVLLAPLVESALTSEGSRRLSHTG